MTQFGRWDAAESAASLTHKKGPKAKRPEQVVCSDLKRKIILIVPLLEERNALFLLLCLLTIICNFEPIVHFVSAVLHEASSSKIKGFMQFYRFNYLYQLLMKKDMKVMYKNRK